MAWCSRKIGSRSAGDRLAGSKVAAISAFILSGSSNVRDGGGGWGLAGGGRGPGAGGGPWPAPTRIAKRSQIVKEHGLGAGRQEVRRQEMTKRTQFGRNSQ